MFGDFKILVLLHDGESKSYLARHPSYDRTVMLHVLPRPESAEYAALAGYWERLPPDRRKVILDRGEHEGASYFVTERIHDFRSLPTWLDKVAPAAGVPAPSSEPVPGPAPPPASPPGEFTRMFQAAPVAMPSVPAPPPAVPAAPSSTGGEFTKMFSGAGTGTRPTADLPIPSQPKKPGAFTKAFLALSDTDLQQGRPAAPLPPPAPPPSKPGEFTALFSSPLPPAPEPVPLPVAKPVVQPSPAPAKPPAVQPAGDFTRMFGTPLPSSPGSDSQVEAEPTSAPPPPPAAPAAPAPTAVPALQSKPADALKAGPSNTILIVVGVVLLVLAAVLIAFFALKH